MNQLFSKTLFFLSLLAALGFCSVAFAADDKGTEPLSNPGEGVAEELEIETIVDTIVESRRIDRDLTVTLLLPTNDPASMPIGIIPDDGNPVHVLAYVAEYERWHDYLTLRSQGGMGIARPVPQKTRYDSSDSDDSVKSIPYNPSDDLGNCRLFGVLHHSAGYQTFLVKNGDEAGMVLKFPVQYAYRFARKNGAAGNPPRSQWLIDNYINPVISISGQRSHAFNLDHAEILFDRETELRVVGVRGEEVDSLFENALHLATHLGKLTIADDPRLDVELVLQVVSKIRQRNPEQAIELLEGAIALQGHNRGYPSLGSLQGDARVLLEEIRTSKIREREFN